MFAAEFLNSVGRFFNSLLNIKWPAHVVRHVPTVAIMSGRNKLMLPDSNMKKDNPSWYKSRSYAHFDRPIPALKAERIVTNKNRVASHAFWPLIINPKKSVSKKLSSNGRRIWSSKKRPIVYAAHVDSHIFSYYAEQIYNLLEDCYLKEPIVGQSVLAYRKVGGKCNIHFASEAFSEIKKRGNCDVVALDIRGFFDSLNHTMLKSAWQSLLNKKRLPKDHFSVFKAVTKSYGITLPMLRDIFEGEVARKRGKTSQSVCSPQDFRNQVAPKLEPLSLIVNNIKGNNNTSVNSPKGIPQGLPISAVLANLYMLETDKKMVKVLKALNGSYRRYSDDILLIVPKGQGSSAEQILRDFLKKTDLEISEEKTERYIVQTDAGKQTSCSVDTSWSRATASAEAVSYLGLTFDSKEISLRPSTISNFWFKAVRGIERAVIAAKKSGDNKLKKRLLYARYTSLEYGSAYGKKLYIKGVLPKGAPRLGFFRYLNLAIKVTGSKAIKKQKLQIENRVYKLIASSESQVIG